MRKHNQLFDTSLTAEEFVDLDGEEEEEEVKPRTDDEIIEEITRGGTQLSDKEVVNEDDEDSDGEEQITLTEMMDVVMKLERGAPSVGGSGPDLSNLCHCHEKILGNPSSTLFAKIFVTSKPINIVQFNKLTINTTIRLALHQTRTNAHPRTNMQWVIRVVSTPRTIGWNSLHRTLSTSQHVMVHLYVLHLKFLSECLSCLPCPHLILHPQEVPDHRTPQLLNSGWSTALSRTNGLRSQLLQSQRPYLTRRLG